MGLKKNFYIAKNLFFLEKSKKIHKNGKMVLVFFNEKQKKAVGKKETMKKMVLMLEGQVIEWRKYFSK